MQLPNAVILNAFWKAFEHVMSTEGIKTSRQALVLENPLAMQKQAVFVMGLAGGFNGALQWSMSLTTAQALAYRICGSPPPLAELHLSALADLLNMVVGQTMMQLEDEELQGIPAPPMVLVGNPRLVTPGFPVMHMPVELDGKLSVVTFAFRVEDAASDRLAVAGSRALSPAAAQRGA